MKHGGMTTGSYALRALLVTCASAISALSIIIFSFWLFVRGNGHSAPSLDPLGVAPGVASAALALVA